MKRRSIHLICNAHIDPVWLWEWQEGAAEAISTFRTAAQICEKNDTFIFNHNEVILYKWIQEYEPSLFKRIQKLVKQGKWHIMGGWYVQPDCNMPCGESFVRQILSGKEYFKKHFNVEPKTAINFDPFGHSRGLVQILVKSGYDSYLFMRPGQEDCSLPADAFLWKGFNSSEVMATRLIGAYSSVLGKARAKVQCCINEEADKDICLVGWGVGNHGGGPSRKDLRQINKLIAQNSEVKIKHSTTEAYFRQLKRVKHTLPSYNKSLNPWAVGCYTSQIRIKQKHRLLENELYMAEKMASTAMVNGLMSYPDSQLREALCDLMLVQFHDILPGSSIQSAEEACLRLLGHGLEIVSRVKARAFFALAAGQPKARPGRIPVMVYNPHPYPVKQVVECEFNLANAKPKAMFTDVYVYHKGKLLPSQVENEQSNLNHDWRKKVVFTAKLEPGQMNRFDCRTELTGKKPLPVLKPCRNKITFENKQLKVIINTRTGLIDTYRVGGVDHIAGGAFEPLIMQDNADCWDMQGKSYGNIRGKFRLADRKQAARFLGLRTGSAEAVRVIEDGPIRSVVEVLFCYGDSFICQQYKLSRSGTEIEVHTRVYWNEKDSMLKLSIPVRGRGGAFFGQSAYCIEQLADNGDEAVAQKWVAVVNRKNNTAFTCINDGIYGSDFSRDGLRLTLLRSPAYACDRELCHATAIDRYVPRMEQGQRIFNFWINAGKIKSRMDSIDRESLVKNEKPMALSFSPSGGRQKAKPLAILDDNSIQLTTAKRTQKGKDLVIRLFEPTGKKRHTILSLPWAGKKIKLQFAGFEIKTIKINTKTKKYRFVDLLEKPVSM